MSSGYDSRIWDEIFRSRAWGKYPAENLIRFIARNFYQLVDRTNVRILEVGCGPGANLWFLAREGFQIYGVDASPAAIEQARNRLNAEVPGWHGELLVGDILHLPFEDEFFDAVLDVEAVYCNDFETSRAIYTEMARVTKPEGKLFSRTFALGSAGDGTGKPAGYHAWYPDDGPLAGKGFSRFTAKEDIPKLYAGFRIDAVDFSHESFYNGKWVVREWLVTGTKESVSA